MRRDKSSPYYMYSQSGITRVDTHKKLLKVPTNNPYKQSDSTPTPKRHRSLLPLDKNYSHLLQPLHDQHATFQLKLSTVQRLWADQSIPSWYYKYFLQVLKKQVSRREQFKMVVDEIRMVRERKEHYYLKIRETVNARENVLALVTGYFGKMSGGELGVEVEGYVRAVESEALRLSIKEAGQYQPVNEEPIAVTSHLVTVLRHIRLYRQLTIRVIELIWEWSCWLRKHMYSGPICFLHGNTDYFQKISEIDAMEIENCSPLFDRHPLMMVKKHHQKTNFGIIFRSLKPSNQDATKILTCVQILSKHNASILKLKLAQFYNRQQQQSSSSPPRQSPTRHRSLIQRLYRSNISLKLPTNYLDRKHPVYLIDKNSSPSPEAKVLEVKHKKSILMSLEPPMTIPVEEMKFKDRLGVIGEFDQQRQNRPQIISQYRLREKDYDKLQRVKFQRTQAEGRQEVENKSDNQELPQEEEQGIRKQWHPPPPQLTFTYIQMEQDRVLEFLQNLFLEREKPQNKIDYLLRTILSHRDCIITKINDVARLGRDKLVGLVIGQQQILSNGKLQFLVIQLLIFNKFDKKQLLKSICTHLQQYNKYSTLLYESKKPKTFGLKINLKPTAPQLTLRTTFKVDRKLKGQVKDIVSQYSHLKLLYKNRRKQEKAWITYNEESEKYEFQYTFFMGMVSTVKVIRDVKSLPREYLKVSFDKVVKLAINAHKNIQGKRLILFGKKEVILVFYSESNEDLSELSEEVLEQYQQLPGQAQRTDVFLPVFNLKFKYMGQESQKVLFKENLSLSKEGLIPLSLIRSYTKYSELILPDNFILRVLTRQGDPIYSKFIRIPSKPTPPI